MATFYDKSSKPIGYIVYSHYGLQSHVVMNNCGVVFSCNPVINENRAKIFITKGEAESARNEFHNSISEVVLITQFEMDDFTNS